MRKLRWWLLGAGLVIVAAIALLGGIASRYQPLSYGGTGLFGAGLPGMPVGQGIQAVNTFGGLHEDIYLPPQSGTFSLFADLVNNGSYPVTIESVSLDPGGLYLAGPVRYSTPDGSGNGSSIIRPTSHVLRGFVLQPGQEVFLDLPLKTWPCAQKDIWQSVSYFYVKERFGPFTRTVAIPWGMRGDALIMHEPGGRPGDPDTFCLPHTVLPKVPSTGGQPTAIAGSILRVFHANLTGDLRITEMTGPDAGSLDRPYPTCMTTHSGSQRVINYDLNWAAADGDPQGTAPRINLTLTGPHGEQVIAVIPSASGAAATCQEVRSMALSSGGQGSQLVLGLIMRVPSGATLSELNAEIDGHPVKIRLSPVCPSAGCFSADPPVLWVAGSPYSASIRD